MVTEPDQGHTITGTPLRLALENGLSLRSEFSAVLVPAWAILGLTKSPPSLALSFLKITSWPRRFRPNETGQKLALLASPVGTGPP